MRKCKLLVVLAGLAVVVAVGVVVLWPRADRVTRENFDCIRKGMTPQEVEGLLGPPGDYSTGPTTTSDASIFQMFDFRDTSHISFWETDTASVRIYFAASGVTYAEYQPLARREQGPLDNLLWRAKRLWHRWFP
jgi:hypothetical protein